jgi:hypothetical protein
MHFTIVFDSQEGYDLTAGLVFKPTPVWVSGGKDLIVLRGDHAGYERGDARRLLDHPALHREFPMESNSVVVVVHESGYGMQRDLDSLIADLESEGCAVTTVPCGSPQS